MKTVYEVVDDYLQWIKAEEMLMTVEGTIPPEMLDETIEPEDDWVGWKSIPNNLSNQELSDFEAKLGFPLPPSYKQFLQYKCFPEFLFSTDVYFPAILPHKTIQILEKFIYWGIPEEIIGKGYFSFASYNDTGFLAFDTNKPKENYEYEIVMIEHDDLDSKVLYAHSFLELLNSKGEGIDDDE